MSDNSTDTQQADTPEVQNEAVEATTTEQTDSQDQPDTPKSDDKPEESDHVEEDDSEDEADDTADDDADTTSDAEKLVAKLRRKNAENQKLRARVLEAEATALKLKVAADLGVPLHLADRLKGETEEAVRKDAEGLMEHLAPSSVLGFVPDDGRRSGGTGEVSTPSLSEIGARIYER